MDWWSYRRQRHFEQQLNLPGFDWIPAFTAASPRAALSFWLAIISGSRLKTA
jgi:hypothetical protein